MPGFSTHYFFGLNTYKQMPKGKLKHIILSHNKAYGLGLQGPDIFFYYPPSYIGINLGNIAHNYGTHEFFVNMLDSVSTFKNLEDKKIALAYVAGFIGHHTLDRYAHPYVYGKTDINLNQKKLDYSKHMALETDIDSELTRYYKNVSPNKFPRHKTIQLSLREKKVVAKVLEYTYKNTYKNEKEFQNKGKKSTIEMFIATITMYLGVGLLIDKTGKKKTLVRIIEDKLYGFGHFSHMVASDKFNIYKDPLNKRKKQWSNPWQLENKSNSSMFDLFSSAKEEYLKILENLEKKEIDKILDAIGNKSYHSGL